jgi:ribosomal protein L33
MKKKHIYGSSETIRELRWSDAFDFHAYQQSRGKIDPDFLTWFIGFFEAEGSFCTWQDKRPRQQIEINQKDPKLMFKIKKNLGFGNVTCYERKNEIYWRYQAGSKDHLASIILLFNNNLKSQQKFQMFEKFVFHFNQIHLQNIQVKPNPFPVDLNSAWLSGFLEGDGRFWVTLLSSQSPLKLELRLKFYVTQKGDEALLNQVKHLFHIQSKTYLMSNGHGQKYNRMETSKFDSLCRVRTYLTKYPFRGQRSILIKRWCRCLNYKDPKFDYVISLKALRKLERLVASTKKHASP